MILQGLYNRILATNNLCTLKKKTLTSFVSKIVKRHKPLILSSYASVNGAHLRQLVIVLQLEKFTNINGCSC
jgi:hypothetical protein